MKKNSLLLLGGGLLAVYLLSRQNNAESSGTMGGGGSGSGGVLGSNQTETLANMTSLLMKALSEQNAKLVQLTGTNAGNLGTPGVNQSNSGTPSALYVTGGSVSPADAGNLGGGRSTNTQELMFQTSSGLRGIAPGGSQYVAKTNTTYSNVGGQIIVRSGR